ncbi:MAG: DUF2617 family protein [Gordonia sp. (in: high G+C Gram-positive bacteria)]|uniref:DUF2617 family protein n=1 Tax=Gordonia sp. (in: high G+C Gram-positive bacteria) TaxID=84139 RepID=UPI0039E6B6A2
MTVLHELGGAFVDTRSADLTLTLDAGPRPALAIRSGTVNDVDVELRLLGASHQVTATRHRRRLRETLACLPDAEPFLPATRTSGGYAFASSITGADENEIRALRDRLTAEFRTAERGSAAAGLHLIGSYPGRDLAFTALRAVPGDTAGTLRWETWHTYPQVGEVVFTASVWSTTSGGDRR